MKYTVRLYLVNEKTFKVEADDDSEAIDRAYEALEEENDVRDDQDWLLPSEVFGESDKKNAIQGWDD